MRDFGRPVLGGLGQWVACGSLGQGTVEAAFMLPAFLLALLLLVQPAILFYDLIVMNQAAEDACRLLATKRQADPEDAFEAAVRRSLGAIPQQDCFHVHRDACSYEVSLGGSEKTAEVKVVVSNRVRLLPVFDAGARVLGLLDDEGALTLTASAARQTYAPWVASSEAGVAPKKWVSQWD